ncbi:sensor histidine kinase [Embleya sp. NBC_00896]|uniref:sensor histidine kinase n=1 Tax=Embleya sp. NBC_00896 TaxID=2975961 RepID=UPI003863C39F|nr:HAMP domain-containing histidine kinase [Embleya sp. NBC_00896]
MTLRRKRAAEAAPTTGAGLPGARQRVARPTARARIAAGFGGTFLVLGGALLTAVYLLARRGTRAGTNDLIGKAAAAAQPGADRPAPWPVPEVVASRQPGSVAVAPPSPDSPASVITDDSAVAHQLRHVGELASRQQLTWSLVVLLVMAVLAVAVGWWTAKRALRPVRTMTVAARRISDRNLHERIGLTGPRDELTELSATFDALLARLDAAFDSQRRFVANASHELRTPLAVQRAAIQIGLESPDRRAVDRAKASLLAANRRSERLIDGLLVLARSDLGLEQLTEVDLGAVVADEVALGVDEARLAGVTVTTRRSTEPVWVAGDRMLLGQLVGNLLRNAVRHNVPGGSAVLVVDESGGLTVTNTGPQVGEDTVADLFEPFRRGAPAQGTAARGAPPRAGDRPEAGGPDGVGLGLSIVRSITRAHRGAVTARANADGGLTVEVTLPTAVPSDSGRDRRARH